MQEQTQMYGYIQLGATISSSAKSENEDKVLNLKENLDKKKKKLDKLAG
jgi:hypothetical protein